MQVDEYFENGVTRELIGAAVENDTSRLKKLIVAGGNINEVGKDGISPLIFAVISQQTSAVRNMLEVGASPNYIAPNGPSAVSVAAKSGDAPTLAILLRHGGDPNIVDTQLLEPVLHVAVKAYKNEVVDLLLAHGADINAVSGAGDTAVMAAAMLNLFDQVVFLLEHGADHTKVSRVGGFLAYFVQENRVNPSSHLSKARNLAKEILEERGVVFPVSLPVRAVK